MGPLVPDPEKTTLCKMSRKKGWPSAGRPAPGARICPPAGPPGRDVTRPPKAIWRFPCNGVPMAQGKEFPPQSSTVSPASCVGVGTSGLSEAETGSEPKVSPPPALPLVVPRRTGRRFPLSPRGGRWVRLGHRGPPASAPPGRVPLCKGWPLRDPASSALDTG